MTITARRISAGWHIDGIPDRDGRPLYLSHADVLVIRALHTGGALPVGASTRGGQVGGNAVTRLKGWGLAAPEAGMPGRVTLTPLGVQVAHAIQEVESAAALDARVPDTPIVDRVRPDAVGWADRHG